MAIKLIEDKRIDIGSYFIKTGYTKIDGNVDSFIEKVMELYNE
jgi:flagellar biosynthesis/type III secretory pathway protein FliH